MRGAFLFYCQFPIPISLSPLPSIQHAFYTRELSHVSLWWWCIYTGCIQSSESKGLKVSYCLLRGGYADSTSISLGEHHLNLDCSIQRARPGSSLVAGGRQGVLWLVLFYCYLFIFYIFAFSGNSPADLIWLTNWSSGVKSYWMSKLCAMNSEYLMRRRTFIIVIEMGFERLHCGHKKVPLLSYRSTEQRIFLSLFKQI